MDDPSLARERTQLAWQRTAFSAVAAAAGCLRLSLSGPVVRLLLAGGLAAVGLLMARAAIAPGVDDRTLRAMAVLLGTVGAVAVVAIAA